MGGTFALALTVLTQIAPTPESASSYAGMAFLVGYLLAAPGPVVFGAQRELTGGFTAVYLTLAGLAVVTLALGLAAAPRGRP
jgi:CP family cyanate transporter-like MFS transporter